ncbi:MAG: PASTA domain-containing protein [Ignavibacteriae bacterium]|nr:PASTA domain-containing protein [Ignavibacteriota bacterium]
MEFKSYKSPDRNLKQRRRINIFLLLFSGIFVVILLKLINIQIIDSEKYKIAARKQYENKITLTPYRGMIYDRNMNVLVSNTHDYSFAADPNMTDDPEKVAELFASVFGKSKQEYLNKLSTPNTSFVYLERGVDIEEAKGLDTMDINGIIVLKEPKRIYNYGSLASQVLGFTNADNKGQSGIELSMDKELSGKEGFVIMQRDGRGNNRPSLEFPRKDSENGNNIVLTLDINIQRFAEEELADGVKKFNAEGGKVIVQSVKTGEVLAMSSYPTFDPNNIKTSDTSGMKNAVITDIFEPGSTFKIITAAASIEENLEDRSSIIATESVNEVKGLKFNEDNKTSSISFQQAIEQSSNAAFSKIALKLGPEKFYKYARDFGIGIYNGIELPGENKGILKRPLDFSGVSLPYMSIGYEVLINSMQLTNAYATIANNGKMMKSYIIKREFSPAGINVFEGRPTMIRQVVSENTAKLLTSLFTGVVERGTGMDAKVEGITVAGKTGTAQRIIKGEYSSSSHNASFVGFFPAEDPQIIITVIINNPQSGEYYGGKVAAPVFQKITTRLINFSGASDIAGKSFVNVNYTGEMNSGIVKNFSEPSDKKLFIPNLLNLRYEDAIEILKENGLSFETVDIENKETSGDSKYIESQYPMPNETVRDNGNFSIKLVVKERGSDEERLLVTPDITNLSLRKAINVLISAGFDADINGSGKIIDQSPKPGTKLLPKSKIIIYCQNN